MRIWTSIFKRRRSKIPWLLLHLQHLDESEKYCKNYIFKSKRKNRANGITIRSVFFSTFENIIFTIFFAFLQKLQMEQPPAGFSSSFEIRISYYHFWICTGTATREVFSLPLSLSLSLSLFYFSYYHCVCVVKTSYFSYPIYL